jgi:bla regulator protein BlaR1
MTGVPMAELARHLQLEAGRVVVDRTNLGGTFDISLETESVPILRDVPGLPEQPIVREGLSLFTALEEQLGLKLVPERGPIQVLVIDHAERPAPN